jgi:hypothetical protein
MSVQNMVTFDRKKLRRFRVAYTAAVKAGLGAFIFDGDDYVTSYAKFVIEYLTQKLGE